MSIGKASEREDGIPTVEELELCLKALKAGRACGPDQIPVQTHRGSESAKNDIFAFIMQYSADEESAHWHRQHWAVERS